MNYSKLSKYIRIFTGYYIALASLYIILELAMTRFSQHIAVFFPFSPHHYSRLLSVVIAIILFGLSREVLKGRRNAYWLTVFLIIIFIVKGILMVHHLDQTALLLVALILLLLSRREYQVNSDNLSLKQGMKNLAILFMVTLTYASLGFYYLEKRDLGHVLNFRQSAEAALIQFFTFHGTVFTPLTHHAKLFLDSVNIAGFVTVLMAFYYLFRPIRFLFPAPDTDRQKATLILERYADSTEDFFKLYPSDKHYFFSSANDAFVAYKVTRDVALILDGPTGSSQKLPELMRDFQEFARQNAWQTAVIHADEKIKNLCQSIGLKNIFIGQEAVIDVEKFQSDTAKDKHFRYIKNKGARENLEFQLWQAPLSERQIQLLRKISVEWISSGRQEYTYIMAPFARQYLRRCDVAVVLKDKQPLAYANLIPTFISDARTIDHMRSVSNSGVAMHFLFLNLIEHLANNSIKYFNLGLTTLSGLNQRQNNTFEKALSFTRNLLNTVYNSSGLENFKARYHPDWQERFICYENGIPGLLKTALALSSAVKAKRGNTFREKILLLSLFAGIAYASFPLAYFLNRPVFAKGLVSLLGSPNAPYAWLFNLLDISSGAICILIGLYFLSLIKKFSLPSLGALSYLVGGLGTLAAAIFPLPVGNDKLLNFSFFLHLLTSSASTGGIILAAVFLSLSLILQKKRSYFIFALTSIYILLAIASLYYYFFLNPDLIQRILILLTGTWIFLFPQFWLRQNKLADKY